MTGCRGRLGNATRSHEGCTAESGTPDPGRVVPRPILTGVLPFRSFIPITPLSIPETMTQAAPVTTLVVGASRGLGLEFVRQL